MMRTINLLPWREELRRERQRNFMIMLVLAAVIAAACVFAVNRYFDARIGNQEGRNSYLKAEIAKLDRQIERINTLDQTRERLLDRKRVIEDLQASRTLMVRLFDQLVRTVPTGIRLVTVSQTGNTITIEGLSQSQARVSTYLRNIAESEVLHAPQLRIIEVEADAADPQMPYRFSLRATVAPPETFDDNLEGEEQ